MAMKKRSRKLIDIYQRLFRFFGPQHWWPGQTPFETTLGAILTQNTAWTNVEKAIHNLKAANAISLKKIVKLSRRQLASLIKPAGYFNVKALRIQSFLAYLKKRKSNEGLTSLANIPTKVLRAELLEVKGIGPETADSILLYALGRPVFVIDVYTKRIFSRHGLVSESDSYDEIQRFFETNSKRSRVHYNEYHALIVALGKEYCRSQPRCEMCPLRPLFGRKIPSALAPSTGKTVKG